MKHTQEYQEHIPSPSEEAACVLLFAVGLASGRQQGAKVSLASLKRAYRKRVFHVHPDRNPDVHEQDLPSVAALSEAFELLLPLAVRGALRLKLVSVHPHLPPQPIKLGEFLKHRKLVADKALEDALIYQAQQRQLFGALAIQLGYLEPKSIQELLDRKTADESIGTYAIRRGWLSTAQRDQILKAQKKSHQPIGQYLLRRGYLNQESLNLALKAQAQHNARYASAA